MMNKIKIARNILIVLLGCIFLYPILLILLNSFKPYPSIISDFLGLPESISFDIYIKSWSKMNFGRLFYNTTLYTVFVVTIVIITSSMAGYMLARTKTVFSKVLSLIFIIPLMLPVQSFMITMTGFAKTTGLIGSRSGYIIILSGLFIPLATFLISRFVITVPAQIEECARIDGASTFLVFFKIIFPLLNPVIITVIIIDAISVWNGFIIQLLILGGKKELYNIQNALYAEFSNQSTDWEHALPGLIISLVPVILFFVFMQGRIVDGIAKGALKS